MASAIDGKLSSDTTELDSSGGDVGRYKYASTISEVFKYPNKNIFAESVLRIYTGAVRITKSLWNF